MTESFHDLTSRGEVKTKAELKAFPTKTWSFPCEIRLNPENHIWPSGGKSADDNNNSGKANKSISSWLQKTNKHRRNNPPSVAPTLRRPTCATHPWNNLTTKHLLQLTRSKNTTSFTFAKQISCQSTSATQTCHVSITRPKEYNYHSLNPNT